MKQILVVLATLLGVSGCKMNSAVKTESSTKAYTTNELVSSPAVWEKAKQAACSLEKAGWKKIPKSYLPRWNGRTLTHGETIQVMGCFANFESTLGAATWAAATDSMGSPLGYWQVKEGHLNTTCGSLRRDVVGSARVALLQNNRDFNAACSLLVFMARSPGDGFEPWKNYCEPAHAVLKKPNGEYVFPQSCNDCDEETVGWLIESASSTSIRVKVSVPKTCTANEAVARLLKKVSATNVVNGEAVIANFSQLEGNRRVAFINIPVGKLSGFTHLRITAKNEGVEFFRTNPSPSLSKYVVEAGPVTNPVAEPEALPEPELLPGDVAPDYFGSEFK